ncbi:MAG: hypothetical protein LBJ00_13930 [Planctomycetaceae bacterium]|nr:hypothetical protein [Planctomycetaceae bacterium]
MKRLFKGEAYRLTGYGVTVAENLTANSLQTLNQNQKNEKNIKPIKTNIIAILDDNQYCPFNDGVIFDDRRK